MPMPQYIQIELNEPIDDFQFYLVNRAWSQVAPKIVEIQISEDGENWETLEKISTGLPSSGGADYTSVVFRPDIPSSTFDTIAWKHMIIGIISTWLNLNCTM